MKKFIKTAFFYAILAMAGGVFYREYTKFSSFSGDTSLGFVHTHLFLLGMMFFLIAALLEGRLGFSGGRLFKPFYYIYNAGVLLTAIMLVVRGVTQVVGGTLSAGADGAISGVAGLGHIMLGAGVVIFFIMLLKCLKAGGEA